MVKSGRSLSLRSSFIRYDAKGNAVTHGRNGMGLTYNYLNLPATANGNGTSVAYTYNAAGQKLNKSSVYNGTTTSRDYIAGIEYKNNVIELIHTEEGVAQNNDGTYTYQYNLSDHLGNVRYIFDVYAGASRRLQADDYSLVFYCFLLAFMSSAQPRLLRLWKKVINRPSFRK